MMTANGKQELVNAMRAAYLDGGGPITLAGTKFILEIPQTVDHKGIKTALGRVERSPKYLWRPRP